MTTGVSAGELLLFYTPPRSLARIRPTPIDERGLVVWERTGILSKEAL